MMRALFFLVVLSGCGASAPPIRPPADTSARLYFDGKLQRVPLLHARVGGRETLAILDSGAEAHLAAGWLVDQLALRTEASAATTIDPSGRTTPLRALADAAFELEGLGAWQDDELMVAELPEVFRQIGIGLILSPQRLVDAGVALVIDFPARTLWREPEARALERLGDDGRRLPEPKACVGARARAGAQLFIVDATIEGQPIRLTLDTGADATLLTTASPVARELMRSYRTTAESAWSAGGEVVMRRTPPLDIHAGELHVTRAIPILSSDAPAGCGQDGQLGLDVLRRCLVVVSPARAGARCPAL